MALQQGAAQWTAAYMGRRSRGDGAEFFWPKSGGTPLNQLLMPVLLEMTEEHCAYCDGFPLDNTGTPTVDHFRPKSRFPDLAYCWDNLFPCCERCQGPEGKADRWEEQALKPDDPVYTFHRFFYYEEGTGRLLPNPAAAPEDQERARISIAFFGLNSGGRPRSRLRHRSNPDFYRYLHLP